MAERRPAIGLLCDATFARTVQRDIDAVRNAITEPWSNGQTEGQINRLKALKRTMYGRAGPELLRARLLPLVAVAATGSEEEERKHLTPMKRSLTRATIAIPSSSDDFANLFGCRIEKGLSEIGVVDDAR